MLKTQKVVCPLCEGQGTTVNPSIDGNGLSFEAFDDDDFRESYFSGRYDIRCPECDGNNVVDEIIPDDSEEYVEYLEDLESERNSREYAEAERRMGA